MEKALQRFWKKVNKTDSCWLWTGTKTFGGYGRIRRSKGPNDDRRGKLMMATRFIYEQMNGPVSKNLFILHRCDNPPCVRPDHLFAGTKKENRQDSILKGRAAVLRGENNPRAKLNMDQVLAIRSAVRSGEAQKDIAPRYGISSSQVSKIVIGTSWAGR